jgi:homoserine kinase
MPAVRVRVPASSANLGPGFDTLGLALNLYNYVTISESSSGDDEVEAMGEGADVLRGDESNIALKAARLLLQWSGAPPEPLRLSLENNIPLARGLGSSSAARVGALVAANEWSQRIGGRACSQEELLTLATQLEGHPDNVAAALLGGLVVSTTRETTAGTTEAVAVQMPVERFPALVVFIPDTELATKSARAVLPDAVFRTDAVFNVARTGLLLSVLATQRWELLGEALRDRLHQDHRAALMRGFTAILQSAQDAGAYGATLSGAGPTILAWVPPDERLIAEVAQTMQDCAAEHEVFGQSRVMEVDSAGCVVVPNG